MLSKCANPACGIPFQYLREGRLYKFELNSPAATDSYPMGTGPARKVEHFWLCGRCAATMTLALEHQRGVIVVPLHYWNSSAA